MSVDNFSKFRDHIWLNGEFVKPQDANTSVMSHTLHYGSGMFEGIRAYKAEDGSINIFRLEEHVQRLIDSAKVYYINIPYTKQEIIDAIKKVVKANKFENCYIRALVYISEGFNTISITENMQVNLMVSCWELKENKSNVDLVVSSYRRVMSSQTPMQAKAIGNYMNSMLIRNEAQKRGANDGIALDMQGYVSETSTANIFYVKDNVIYSPDLSSSILNGITRLSIIKVLKDNGYKVVERKISRDELYYADEIFITGTACEVKGCNSVDDIKVGTGNYPISEFLKTKYKEILLKVDTKYSSWLENVY